MKRFVTGCACLILMLVPASGVFAQHQHEPGGATPSAGDTAQPSPADQPSMHGGAMMRPGARGDGMMGREIMAMCPMMMRPSMMQGAMAGQTDPTSIGLAEAMAAGNMEATTMGHMLQMRGEILQAIGGIMLKYGRALEQER